MTMPNDAIAAMQPEERRALLAQLLREKARTKTSFHPLSYGQRAMWFMQQLAPASAAYNTAVAARIRSQVNIPALRRAFQTIIDRHEALRTGFVHGDGGGAQAIYGARDLVFEAIDAAMDGEETLRQRVQAAYERPFDLAQGNVLRVHLFTRAPADHVLLLVVHHIAVDGQSMGLILDEFLTLYRAEMAGVSAGIPDAGQYREFVDWQTAMLAGPDGQRLREYWLRQLSGELSPLHLPIDHPRPQQQLSQDAVHEFRLDEPLLGSLRALAKSEHTTLYTVLLAALYVLLRRYTDQDDIIIGSPTATRGRLEFQQTIGYMVNPLALRANLSGDPPFRGFVGQVRRIVLDGLAHQDYPFALLVEQLRPIREPGRSPIFDVMFNLNSARRLGALAGRMAATGERPSLPSGELVMEQFPLRQQEGQFDLSINALETEQALLGTVRYSLDLFDPETVGRMFNHWRTLLESICANPDAPIGALPMLTAPERRRLLVEWNDTRTEYPRDACIHELFEAQAKRTPDAVALAYGDERLTYAALDARANRLAQHLQTLGVGPESLVGICVERSIALVVGLLGILKAGGAYLPLDPTYPVERLAFMLADARAPLLLTQHALVGTLPTEGIQVVCLDGDEEVSGLHQSGYFVQTMAHTGPVGSRRSQGALHAFASEPVMDTENPESGVLPANLAYVIYTSGSTGVPKGVQIAHRNVVNFLAAMRERPGLDERDVLLSVTSISFDIAALELFLPLTVGARVVIAARDVCFDGKRLWQLMERVGATLLQATPSTWRLLLAAGWRNDGRLTMLCGGEALPADLGARLSDGGAPLWNMYGPTETTIWSCVHPVAAETAGPAPIGRPIANTQIYLLDRHLQPVPIGVPGELYIGGDGLARGYLNRPDLTAERFVPNPFSSEPGARLYKTGDRARYRPDGHIDFLGRTDRQVKIRGHRIELGEVEAALRCHPRVRDAVTVVREGERDDKRLVAYVVAHEDVELAPLDLRPWLKERLPDYMLPSAVVPLATLPLSPNGKVDLRALPAPDEAPRDTPDRVEYNPLRYQLTQIWQDVLGVAPIGPEDSFFDLGGHSLLAVRLVGEVERVCGVAVSLATLFTKPTIAELAEALLQHQAGEQQPLVKIQADGGKRPFAFVHGDYSGGGFYCHSLARSLDPDRPFYALQPHGLDARPIPPTIEEMASSHLAALRAVQPEGPYLLGGYCNGGLIAVEMARRLVAAGQRVDAVIVVHAAAVNARLAPLHDAIWRVGGLLGWSNDKRVRTFLRVRFLIIKWLARSGTRQRAGLVVRGARALALKGLGREVRSSTSLLGSDRALEQEVWAEDARQPIYAYAVAAHIPRPYSGRLTLVWPEEETLGSWPNPAAGWELVTREVEVRQTPGSHISCITTHVQALAACLRGAIDAAEGAAGR